MTETADVCDFNWVSHVLCDGIKDSSYLMKFQRSNYSFLPLLFRVALNEEYNKMSANALAIIFAPTILKTDRPQTAQDSLNVVSKQSL